MVSQVNQKSNKKQDSENILHLLPQIDALMSDLRLEIFFLLNIFGELNLTQLSQMLRKSKPALHRHLQILIEAGIVRESKEEKVRGSIKAKYYELVIDVLNIQINRDELLAVEDLKERVQNAKKIIQLERSKYLVTKGYIEYIKHYLDRIDELLDGDPTEIDWNLITTDEFLLKSKEFRLDLNLLSDETHALLHKYNLDFIKEANEYNNAYKAKHGKKPKEETLVVLTTIPIRKLMDFKIHSDSAKVKRIKRLLKT